MVLNQIFLLYFFNYQISYTGGGIFFQISNFILGRGVDKNLTLAHVSCNLATLLSRDIKSISRSIQLRTELETKVSSEQIKRAEKLSRKCIEKKFKECIKY